MIFLHSSWRTSSTWLWNIFRALPETVAYHEVFHEILATLKTDQVNLHTSSRWRSKHGEIAPYFLDFIPVLKPEGGALHYREGMAFDRYIPASGIRGEIDAEEERYTSHLITIVERVRKTPVLSATRSLGRLCGIKKRLGGWHVFLYRDLYQQWISYANQSWFKNDYFLMTIHHILARNRHDPFFNRLCEILNGLGMIIGDERPKVDQATFIAFVGLHLYLSMNAATLADCCIDVNLLTRDPSYRQAIQKSIAAAVELNVDLSSARNSIEFAPFFVENRMDLGARLEEVLQVAVDELERQGVERSTALPFGQGMLDTLMASLDHHQFNIAALKPVIAQLEAPAVQNTTPVTEPKRPWLRFWRKQSMGTNAGRSQ